MCVGNVYGYKICIKSEMDCQYQTINTRVIAPYIVKKWCISSYMNTIEATVFER